jgi:hypothetical protein
MEAREKFESKINELHKSELVFSTVKKDVDGNIAPNEIQFLCRGCMENFVDRYEIPEERPHEGSRFVFKNFCNKLAGELGCESEYVDIYDFGILKETTGNLLVCRGTLKQPPANIALFNPRMIIAAVNFFADRMTIPDHERFHYYRPALKPESIRLVAFNTASSLVLPTLAYDCSTDEHAYVPVGVVEPSDEQVIETLAAIDYLVSPTEKAYKAAHNRIIEICRDLGLELGFRSETEYRFGSDRIDVAWLNPPNESLEVAIEVELGSSVTDELWKLCEAKPRLATLIVRGSYFDTARNQIASSDIVRKMNQKIMLLDISEKRHVIVSGSTVLTYPTRIQFQQERVDSTGDDQ